MPGGWGGLRLSRQENVLPVSGLGIVRTNFPLRSTARKVRRAVLVISWEQVIRVSREKGGAAGGGEHPARGPGERAVTRGGVQSTPILEQVGNVWRRKVLPNAVPSAGS